MTPDSALAYHPTESLILPDKRRFFPFKIPNFHQQLRHYISTVDPDRIYVVVDRVIYSIHISSQKRETVAVIPFEPKCLAAGYGWIGVGGSDNGECAFIRISERAVRLQEDTPAPQASDVDSALPIDIEAPTRVSLFSDEPSSTRQSGRRPRPDVRSTRTRSPSLSSDDERSSTRQSNRRALPDVQLHKFGGSIVNSVTIHRLPGNEKGLADEDIIVLSNNDKTVTIYSLTRAKVLKVLNHNACMNYAIMSPDSTMLAAVGDEVRAYFYKVTRTFDTTARAENGNKLTGWDWDLLRSVDMEIGTRFDDACCFTIAFSEFSRLCAIGSQSGVITLFDVKTLKLRDVSRDPLGKNAIICHFNSSRPCCNGGAVRCLAFAPEPWDLLVWLEDKGRAGIADVRQAFIRRQVLELDSKEPEIQEVRTEPLLDDSFGLGFDLDDEHPALVSGGDLDAEQRGTLDPTDRPSNDPHGDELRPPPLRDNVMQDLTERERLIVEFLNTARWTQRLEEGVSGRRARANAQPPPVPRSRYQNSTEESSRASRPTSPPRHAETPHGQSREDSSSHAGIGDRRQSARRQSSVLLSQSNTDSHSPTPEAGSSQSELQPSITLSWTASPSELQGSTPENRSGTSDQTSHGTGSSSRESGLTSRLQETPARPSANFDYSDTSADLLRPRAHQRSHSVHRRPERYEPTSNAPPRLSITEMRTNVAAERLRRQREVITDAHNRNNEREQRYRQHILGFEQARSPRWIRSMMNEIPERTPGVAYRDQDPGSTAGIGWGADGRSLYIATVEGIFEYQINIRDRKTFPVITYR